AAGMRQVHADLVRAPGLQACLDERELDRQLGPLDARQTGNEGERLEAAGIDADATIAVGGLVALQRKREAARAQRPPAGDDRPVALVDLALAQLRMQVRQRRPPLREQQHARSLAVEPMHQLEEARLRTRGAQLFDDAAGYAAAAVHRDRRRLVQRDEVVVLVEHDEPACELRAL